jgi:phage tail-like protein
MTRAAASDPLHNFRFHAKADPITGGIPGTSGLDVLQPDPAGIGDVPGGEGEGTEAGFSAITTPEITVEPVEYREGIRVYTQKYPGLPSIADITLSRGVARGDTAFFNWVLAAIEGSEYRTAITIYHIQRPARTLDRDTSDGSPIFPLADDDYAKLYKLKQCIPGRIKIAADMDASTGDISIAELDVAFEHFDVERPAA